ncbi:hypothetical protein MRX96_018847 [Rhipicephalus microplus]
MANRRDFARLILANPPLLLLIIGCLPLFLVLVPTASSRKYAHTDESRDDRSCQVIIVVFVSVLGTVLITVNNEGRSPAVLNSYSAPTTPLDDAAEFEKPASSIAANAAAAANDQIDADVQNAPHLPERHHHTSRTPASRRGDVVSHRDKAFQTTRRPQRTTGRRSTTREEEKEEEIIRTTGSNLRRDSPSPPGKNLTELEHVPGKKLTSPWTRGPSQALTGPKGRRLVRRVVRKRRRTTPELASNTPTEAPVSHLGTTAVAAAGSLEDRKTDETQEPGKHLQGISFAKAPAPSGRIETSGTSATPSTSKGSSLSIAQASEALSGAKGQRQSDVSARSSEATVGVPTNETCDDSSRCRVPSYNEGFGSLNGMTREKPGAFQHSSELTGDVTSPSRTRESNDELTETAATYSIAPGLLDWLFDHGANNGLSEKRNGCEKGSIRTVINHEPLSSTTPLSHLGDIQNASVVSGVPKTELSITSTTKTSTRRRLRLETTLHNTVPVVLELTSPTGTVSSKAQGHTLPKKLNIMCSIGATYPGPYPVDLCDKILIKDAVAFDQVRIKFTVRSYGKYYTRTVTITVRISLFYDVSICPSESLRWSPKLQ